MYKLFKRTHKPGLIDIHMAGACDPGIMRDHNEDAIKVQEDHGNGYYLALVCDGMGGHNAGEIASSIAIETISDFVKTNFATAEKIDDIFVEELIAGAFSRASQQIDQQAQMNSGAKGMGCTAVMLLGVDDKVYVGHAGDSRAYRLRGEELEQITLDHTMVQEMVTGGLITEEQAAEHPYRGRISRCLGHGKSRDQPTVNRFEFEAADNILLCSDGLSDVVEESEIKALMGQRDVRSSSHRLIDAANKSGGPDNISAIVIRRSS